MPNIRGITKRRLFVALLCVVALLATAFYVGTYWKARSDGLFVGAAETFVPYGGTPSGKYEIKPIGYLSLGIPSDGYSSEAEHLRAIMKLRADQERSRKLWPYFSWLAQVEELFH